MFRFVLRNGGWWLKLSNMEDVANYYTRKNENYKVVSDATDRLLYKGFETYIQRGETDKSNIDVTEQPANERMADLIELVAKNKSFTAPQAVLDIKKRKMDAQIKCINEGYDVYINECDGWNIGKHDYTQWCDREKPIFPNYTEKDIKVESFEGGKHFYLYIGNIQFRDGDKLKWDTYDEAYKFGLKELGISDKEKDIEDVER